MQNLRLLRRNNKLTMKELADKINLSESAISLYERGKREPDNDIIKKLADYFEVSIDFLLGREFKQETEIEPRASPLTDEQQQLIENYEKLDTHKKMRVQGYIESLIDEDILQKGTKWS